MQLYICHYDFLLGKSYIWQNRYNTKYKSNVCIWQSRLIIWVIGVRPYGLFICAYSLVYLPSACLAVFLFKLSSFKFICNGACCKKEKQTFSHSWSISLDMFMFSVSDACYWWQFPSEFSKSNGTQFLINDQNKYRSMWIRAYSSMWMLGVVSVVIYLGHLYMWGTVVVIQIFMASELFNLLRRAREDKHLPGFRLLKW